MSRGTVVYVTPTGQFRLGKASITHQHPNFARNRRDNQSHPLEESPVIPTTRPVSINDINQLMEPDPPPPQGIPTKKWHIICEDNAIWPYSCKMVLTAEEFERRQRKRMDYYEEGVQYGRQQVLQKRASQGVQTFAAVAAVVVFSICCLLAVMFLAVYGFGDNSDPPPAAGLAPLLFLGAVATAATPKGKGQSKARVKKAKKEKIPRVRVYVFNLQDGTVAHKLAPLALIREHFSKIPIYGGDILPLRAMFTLAVAVLGSAMIGTVLFGAVGEIVGFVAGMGAFPALLLLGWVISPGILITMNPLLTPFTMFYLREREDEDGRDLVPIRHTLGRGVDPLVYDLIKDEMMERQRKLMAEQGLAGEVEYTPTVNRATGLHQNLEGHLIRFKFRFPRTTEQAIQLGSLILMAFGSLGVLFFVAFS